MRILKSASGYLALPSADELRDIRELVVTWASESAAFDGLHYAVKTAEWVAGAFSLSLSQADMSAMDTLFTAYASNDRRYAAMRYSVMRAMA